MASDKQMLLEHAGLVSACAQLMNGQQPDWSTLCLSRETRNRIADIADRKRAAAADKAESRPHGE